MRNTGSTISTQNIEFDIEILQPRHWYHLCIECPTKKQCKEVPRWFPDIWVPKLLVPTEITWMFGPKRPFLDILPQIQNLGLYQDTNHILPPGPSPPFLPFKPCTISAVPRSDSFSTNHSQGRFCIDQSGARIHRAIFQ